MRTDTAHPALYIYHYIILLYCIDLIIPRIFSPAPPPAWPLPGSPPLSLACPVWFSDFPLPTVGILRMYLSSNYNLLIPTMSSALSDVEFPSSPIGTRRSRSPVTVSLTAVSLKIAIIFTTSYYTNTTLYLLRPRLALVLELVQVNRTVIDSHQTLQPPSTGLTGVRLVPPLVVPPGVIGDPGEDVHLPGHPAQGVILEALLPRCEGGLVQTDAVHPASVSRKDSLPERTQSRLHIIRIFLLILQTGIVAPVRHLAMPDDNHYSTCPTHPTYSPARILHLPGTIQTQNNLVPAEFL